MCKLFVSQKIAVFCSFDDNDVCIRLICGVAESQIQHKILEGMNCPFEKGFKIVQFIVMGIIASTKFSSHALTFQEKTGREMACLQLILHLDKPYVKETRLRF